MNKAPDKLFRVDGWITDEYPQKAESYIEYIRKDYLLEWVKEKKENSLTQLVKLTYQTIIDKIQSL